MAAQQPSTSLPLARTILAISTCLVLSGVGFYYMRMGPAAQAAGRALEAVSEPGDFRWPGTDHVLRRVYTGFAPVDTGLSFLVAAFLPGVRGTGMNGAFEVQQPYFLMSFGPILSVMSVEAARARNAWSVMSFTTIWGLFYQTVGGAVIVPLWFAFYFWTTSRSDYWQKPMTISAPVAQGLFLAFWAGYGIPTIAIYLPGLDARTRQALVAFWQPVPIWVNILWAIIPRFLPSADVERPKEEFSDPTYWVKFLHTSNVFLSIFCHWTMLYSCLFSMNPDVTFINVHLPLPRDDFTMDQALLFIFQVDFWLIIGSALLWAYVSIGDLAELGMTNIEAPTGLVLIFFATNLLGPGAAISLVSIWREDRMRNAAQKGVAKKTW